MALITEYEKIQKLKSVVPKLGNIESLKRRKKQAMEEIVLLDRELKKAGILSIRSQMSEDSENELRVERKNWNELIDLIDTRIAELEGKQICPECGGSDFEPTGEIIESGGQKYEELECITCRKRKKQKRG